MTNLRMQRTTFAVLAVVFILVTSIWVSNGAFASVGAADDPPPFSPEDLPDAVRFPRAAVIEAVESGQITADGGYTPEIVGGVEVDPANTYPWMASLQYYDQPYCGGSLIGGDGEYAQWVLTAAHCWVDDFGNVLPFDEHDTVVLGEHDFATISGDEVVSHIAEVHMYPGYFNFPYSYDLALIKLDAPVPVSDVISPINIAHVSNLEHFPATTIGWGVTSFGGLPSDVLLEAQIEIFPDSLCELYGTSFNPDTMVCAGAPDYSADSCQADSGGPLFIQEEFGSYLLVGVTSFGRGCATPDYPGVYADVAGGLAWVYSLLYPSTLCADQSSIPQTECEALTDLYYEANGETWINNTNWMTNPDPCTWFGVTCTAGHVTEVDLDYNGLSGYLPYTLGNLPNLELLDLWVNELAGTIPENFGSLSNLRYLSLTSNHISGEIPPSLGNLSLLETLSLSENRLTGTVPVELGNLTNLESLRFSSNPLSGTLPYQLSNLTHLIAFMMSSTDISGPMPIDYVQMFDLEYLTYGDTGICEPQYPAFEDWLSGMPTPPYRTNIPCLPSTDPSTVPAAELNALIDLYHSTNGDAWTDNTNWLADDSPCDWYGVTCREGHVTRLDLDINNLDGQLPASLVDLPYLNWLGMGFNYLTGTIPAEIGQLTDLVHISFEANRLTGSIPVELAGLSNLKRLNLQANLLEDELPSELGNLSSLQYLYLAYNNFIGSLPGNFTNLVNLKEFDFSHTVVCIPEDAAIQAWLSGIVSLSDSGFSCTFCVDQTDIPQTECEGLVDLFGSTQGIMWSNPSGQWLESDAICTWYGVSCAEGHISALELEHNNLNGVIPDSIGGFPSLQMLDLSGNWLHGALPVQIGNLTNVTIFDIAGNQLTGAIPSSLGYLNKVTELFLASNQFEGTIPSEIGNMSALFYLDLNDNPISGSLPAEIGNLSNLRNLLVEETNLSGPIPLEFMQLDLGGFIYQYTDICEPQTPEFQAWLAGISFVLGTDNPCSVCNTQTDVPQTECAALEAFYNSTDGDHWLDNTGWKVDENVCAWYAVGCDAGHVVSIDFNIGLASDNHVTGVLPPEIGDLTYLNELRITNNAISGPLPAEFFGLSGLEVLDLENNLLDGGIPTAISGLTALRTLNLRENAFTGSLPAELYQLSTLEWLELAENNLDGSLPADIQNLSNLTWLDLSANTFSGNIPSELGNIPNLVTIYLSGNEFSGSIPESLGNLSYLQRLGLGNNQLEGEIPTTFLGRYFHMLSLANNQLSGEIPNLRFVGDYYVSYLYLNNNQFTGPIPTSISEVTFVDLSYNQLSGDIPLFRSKSVNFSHNNLDGSFYETPEYRGTTDYADYSYNQIGGQIPDLRLAYYELNLSHNNFVGGIPDGLFLDTRLDHLDVSFNQLDGTLPGDITNMGHLYYFLVNDNNFIGGIPEAYVGLPMQTFYFNNTGICTPDTPEMQTWLDSITDLQTTGSICSVPVASFLAPVEGGIVLQPRSWVMARAEDPVSGMKQVEFYAKLNGTWTLLAVDTTEEDGWRYLWSTYAIEQHTVDLKLVAVNNQNFQTVVTMEGLTVTDHFTSPEGYQSRGNRPTGEEPAESAQPESQIEPSFESQESASPPRVVVERKFTPMEHVMTNFRFKFWWFTPLRMPY